MTNQKLMQLALESRGFAVKGQSAKYLILTKIGFKGRILLGSNGALRLTRSQIAMSHPMTEREKQILLTEGMHLHHVGNKPTLDLSAFD